jgi:phage nucleotide-binding protein
LRAEVLNALNNLNSYNEEAPMKIIKAPTKINRGISFIIFGHPGAGKTTLATSLPVGETLIVNSEAGLGPLLGTGHYVFNVREADKNTETTLSDLHRSLKTNTLAIKGIKNIVIDNISEVVDLLVLDYTTERSKKFPELKEHGDAAYKIRELMHNYRDLVYDGYNVVFNAWEFIKEIRSSDGVMLSKTIPMIGNKIAFQMSGIVDCVGHIEADEKSDRRWIRFGPSNQYLTKTQFKGLDAGEVADLPLILKKLKEYDYSVKGDKDGD